MADPTRGFAVSVDKETALGTPAGTPLVWRLADRPTFPDAPKELVEQANLKYHPGKVDDPPLHLETVQEGAIKLALEPRLAGDTKIPPIMQSLQAAGWGLSHPGTATTTIATYASDSEFTLTADIGCEIGDVLLIELDNGKFFPALIADWNAGTKTVELAMALPTAASADNDVYACYTAIPLWDALGATDALSIYFNTRGTHTAGDDLRFAALGCSAGALDAITFEPGKALPTFGFSYHVADLAYAADALVAGTAGDLAKLNAFAGVDFGFAAAAAAGQIAHATKKIISAVFTPPVLTSPIPAEGSSAAVVNSCQGYMADPENTGQLEVTFLQEKTLADEAYEIGDVNEEKYIHIAVPTSSHNTVPAFSIHLPRCRQVVGPPIDWSEKYVKMTCTFRPSSATFGADTGLSAPGMAPVFIAIPHPWAV